MTRLTVSIDGQPPSIDGKILYIPTLLRKHMFFWGFQIMILAPPPQANQKDCGPKANLLQQKGGSKSQKKTAYLHSLPKVSCMQRDGGKVTSAIKLLISTAWLQEFPINAYNDVPTKSLNQGVGTYNPPERHFSHKCHTCHMAPLIHRMKGWAPSS